VEFDDVLEELERWKCQLENVEIVNRKAFGSGDWK